MLFIKLNFVSFN